MSLDGQTWKVTDHVMEQIAWNLCTRRLVNQTYGKPIAVQLYSTILKVKGKCE